MAKFRIKVELQSLKIDVEGSREDVPRLALKVGEQFGKMITPALLLADNGRASETSKDETSTESASGKSRKKRAGSGGSKTSAPSVNLSVDPAKHGTPMQSWNIAQKAIWFLWAAKESGSSDPMTGYAIAKNFNKHFKAAGALNAGNVNTVLEKERTKGAGATVGADTNDGTVRYFLTQTGTAVAQKLAKGDTSGAD
jgi:hypothetical protein